MTNLNLRAIKVRELKAGMLLCLNDFRYAKVDKVEWGFDYSFVTINGIMEERHFPLNDYVVIVSDEPIGEPVEIVTADMLMDGWFVFDSFNNGGTPSGRFEKVYVLNVERPLIEGNDSVFIIKVGWHRSSRVPSDQRFMVLSR